MTEEKLLTVREVATYLGITEKEVLDLAENGSIPAYKLGGLYLRFKKNQVEEYAKKRINLNPKTVRKERLNPGGKIRDFFYFNDFYILAALCIILLVIVVYRGQQGTVP